MSQQPDAGPDRRAGAQAGVIHDIGFRHYDGSRLGRSSVRGALFWESLKNAYGFGRSARSKVMPLLLLGVMCLPAVVIVIVTSMSGLDSIPDGYGQYPFTMQVVVAIFVAAQAPVGVSRDLRFRTVSLYFSRPLERSDYVHSKLAAMAVAVFALLALPLTVLFVGALLAKLPWDDQLGAYLRALGAAAVYGVLLASIGLVVAALTPRRGLGVAAVVAVLLVLSGVQGAVRGIATEAGQRTLADYAGLISPFGLADGVAARVLRTDTSGLGSGGGWLAAGVYLAVTVLVVAACYAALRLRYRKVGVS